MRGQNTLFKYVFGLFLAIGSILVIFNFTSVLPSAIGKEQILSGSKTEILSKLNHLLSLCCKEKKEKVCFIAKIKSEQEISEEDIKELELESCDLEIINFNYKCSFIIKHKNKKVYIIEKCS